MSSRADRTLAAATSGFRYLFLLNLGSKLVTFGANAYVVRVTSPEQQGARFNLELCINSVLFFSREAFRTAALRRDVSDGVPAHEARRNFSDCLRVGWAAAAFGAVLSVAAGAYFVSSLETAHPDWAALGDISVGVWLHFAGALLEVLAEPLFIAAQGLCLYSLRVNVEASALALRVAATAALLALGADAVLAFGCAQLLYGAVTAVGYWLAFAGPRASVRLPFAEGDARPELTALLPAWGVPRDLLVLLRQLQLEAAMRLLLTEGEKFVLARWAVLAAQGVYEVVSHLGSVVCRILFKFLEEAALMTWSKLLAASAVKEARSVLQVLARFLVIIGLCFACFGPSYSHALLYMLFGQKWVATEAPQLLALYCVYIPTLGLNGISEAFYRAAASPDGPWLPRLWRFQTAFSALYLGLCYVLAVHWELGPYGLIAANCAVMLARIAFCATFMAAFFAEEDAAAPRFSIAEWVPSPAVLAAGAAGCAVTLGSERALYTPTPRGLASHVGVGLVMFGVFCAAVATQERALLRDMRKLLKSRRD
eukprot:TRINITY_DN14570_c0_g1_i1.p1 TRINITY_DN14570_c0_g1~~TRINITY_DN14570_c0_g1_i1.p1  ORF type:complete len:563 (+),score=158.62 TRINITY_DN14570_c0_g1_i1:73-1689(+)